MFTDIGIRLRLRFAFLAPGRHLDEHLSLHAVDDDVIAHALNSAKAVALDIECEHGGAVMVCTELIEGLLHIRRDNAPLRGLGVARPIFTHEPSDDEIFGNAIKLLLRLSRELLHSCRVGDHSPAAHELQPPRRTRLSELVVEKLRVLLLPLPDGERHDSVRDRVLAGFGWPPVDRHVHELAEAQLPAALLELDAEVTPG